MFRPWFLVSTLASFLSFGVLGCSDPDTSKKKGKPTTGDAGVAGAPSQAGATCGELECEADTLAAMILLKTGRFQEAFEAYQCGDTAEAAFGAALTKMVTSVESSAVAGRSNKSPPRSSC